MGSLTSLPIRWHGRRTEPRLARWLLAMLSFGLAAGVPAQQSADPELKRLLIEAVDSSESFPDRFDAQVWLTDMSSRLARQVTDPQERIEILKGPQSALYGRAAFNGAISYITKEPGDEFEGQVRIDGAENGFYQKIICPQYPVKDPHKKIFKVRAHHSGVVIQPVPSHQEQYRRPIQ